MVMAVTPGVDGTGGCVVLQPKLDMGRNEMGAGLGLSDGADARKTLDGVVGQVLSIVGEKCSRKKPQSFSCAVRERAPR